MVGSKVAAAPFSYLPSRTMNLIATSMQPLLGQRRRTLHFFPVQIRLPRSAELLLLITYCPKSADRARWAPAVEQKPGHRPHRIVILEPYAISVCQNACSLSQWLGSLRLHQNSPYPRSSGLEGRNHSLSRHLADRTLCGPPAEIRRWLVALADGWVVCDAMRIGVPARSATPARHSRVSRVSTSSCFRATRRSRARSNGSIPTIRRVHRDDRGHRSKPALVASGRGASGFSLRCG
jgi:hypothetical protein